MPSKGRWLRFAVVASLGPVSFAACTTSSRPPIEATGPTYPTHGGTASSGTDASASCYGSDGGCNNLSLCGEKIFVSEVAQTAPTGTGGTVAPGLYALTEYLLYTGTGGATGTPGNWSIETLVLSSSSADGGASDSGPRDADSDGTSDAGADGSGTSAEAGSTARTLGWQDVAESDQGGVNTSSGAVITDGTSLVFQAECATASSLATTYTATASTFVIYYDDPGNGTAALTYTLMP